MIFHFITTISYSQKILWEKTYGGIHSEYLFDIKSTADYGFLLAGSSLSGKTGNKNSKSQGGFDFWIWKMDENGRLEWQRSFGGSGADHLKSVQTTLDGGYILAGTSNSTIGGDKKMDVIGKQDLWIIKLNAEGEEQWQNTIGTSGKDDVKSIQLAHDGGYIIGGSSNGIVLQDKTIDNYGGVDYWVTKISSSGVVEWQKMYGGRYLDKLEVIIPVEKGGYIIGGWSNSPKSGIKERDSYGEGDYWILKIDNYGEIEWQKTIGGDQDDYLTVIIESRTGGFVVGGSSRSNISGLKEISNGKGSDFWVVKLSENGEIIWQNTYDIGENDFLTSLLENENGELLIGGHAKTENTGLNRIDKEGVSDYIILKTDAEGEEIWRKSIGSSGIDNLNKLVETRDGGYVLAGTSRGALSRDKSSNKGLSDFWIVKLLDEEKPVKERFYGLEAFPNPTSSYTNVIVNHEFEEGIMQLIDITGKKIQRFTVQNRIIPVNLENLPLGIYIVTVKTNIKTESVKILKK